MAAWLLLRLLARTEPRQHIARVLDELVEVEHPPPPLVLRADVRLQMPQLVGHRNVQVIVTLRAERRRAELAEHRRRVLQAVAQVALVERALHVKRLRFDHLARLRQALRFGLHVRRVHLLIGVCLFAAFIPRCKRGYEKL